MHVAEDDRGDDRADAVELAQRCARGDGGDADAISDRVQFCIDAAKIGEMFVSQSLAFCGDEIIANVDALEELGPVSCTDPQRSTTSGELAQHHMQPTRRLGAQRDQVMVTIGEQPQDRRMTIAAHSA